MNKKKSCIFGSLMVILLVLFDQLTKYLATLYLKGGNSVDIIKNVFQLHYLDAGNRGAAFGLFEGGRIWFIVFTLLLIAGLVYIYWHSPMEKKFRWIRIVIVGILSGAFGNLIDRIYLGYVIDFLYFELIDFPIFNVADIYVCCSVAALLILYIFYYKEEDVEALVPSRKKKDGRNENV